MKKSYIFAAVSVLCWSTVATVTKLLLGTFSSIEVLCISSFFASVSLLLVNIATSNIKKLRTYKPIDYLKTVSIGLTGTFLYYLFYYTGASKMLASQAFIVNYLWPIMSVIFACIILGEKMTPRKALAIALSFAGVVVVMGTDLLHFDKNTLLGALFCALGAVSYGIFTALNQKTNYDKRISMMFFYATTFVLTLIISLCNGGFPKILPAQILGFAWNGIFTMALANTSWMLALESKNTSKISNLAYATPFLSLVWTALILKEKIRITSIFGLVIIVAGILIQLTDKKTKSKK